MRPEDFILSTTAVILGLNLNLFRILFPEFLIGSFHAGFLSNDVPVRMFIAPSGDITRLVHKIALKFRRNHPG